MAAAFKSHTQRLHSLFHNPRTIIDGVEMFSDTASMATTVTSSLASTARTDQTGRTGKQRRKMARKRAGGKGIFEPEYILGQINVMRLKVVEMQSEVGELLKGLMLVGMIDECEKVQLNFTMLLDLVIAVCAFELQRVEEGEPRVEPVDMKSIDWKCSMFN